VATVTFVTRESASKAIAKAEKTWFFHAKGFVFLKPSELFYA